MKLKFAFAILLALASAFGDASEPVLFHLNVQGQPVENGKTLNMNYQELERGNDFSIVEVTFTSGGSVSSAMFILRGTCGVARARGEKYFRTEQLSKAPITFRVQFLPEATERDLQPEKTTAKVWSVAECALIGM